MASTVLMVSKKDVHSARFSASHQTAKLLKAILSARLSVRHTSGEPRLNDSRYRNISHHTMEQCPQFFDATSVIVSLGVRPKVY